LYFVGETIKTADCGYVHLHGYRPKSVTASMGWVLCWYYGFVCNDSAAEALFAVIVAPYTWTLPLPLPYISCLSLCSIDRLTVLFQLFDVSTSTILGKFCGRTIPPPIRTSSNRLRVHFLTDTSNSGRGFLLNWSAESSSVAVTRPPVNTTNPPGTRGARSSWRNPIQEA